MDSFNDLMKKLENTGSNNIDPQKVEDLAAQLVGQGIANSMMEAREKAKAMLKTEKTVQKDVEQKKASATTYNDPRNNPYYNRYKQANIEEFRKRALEGRPMLKIQTDFQTPGFESKTGTRPTRQTFAKPKIETTQRVAPQKSELISESNPSESIKAVQQKPIEQPKPVQQPVQKSVEQPEQTVEKKKNPSVDLGSVFNFGSR